MASNQDLSWTFDTVASVYDKFRPGYVTELYQEIFHYIPIHSSSKVVEIGIGSGQATLPVLQTGCELTAVEYGAHFSELCRKKFQDYPKFSVVTGKFEDAEFCDDSYDLVFSATAFHWIPEEIGYPKVFSMLKSGGTFARFANHPMIDQSNPTLTEEINQIYQKYYYQHHKQKKKTPIVYGEEHAKQLSSIAQKYGFIDTRYAIFRRTRTFSAEEYSALLGTYSDHIALEETLRKEFFSLIEKAINHHGGTVTICDTIDLQLARKP